MLLCLSQKADREGNCIVGNPPPTSFGPLCRARPVARVGSRSVDQFLTVK